MYFRCIYLGFIRHIPYRWKDVGKHLLELHFFDLHIAYELSSKFATKVGLSSSLLGQAGKKLIVRCRGEGIELLDLRRESPAMLYH